MTADPAEILADVYARLGAAVADRHSALRTPALATAGMDGRARVRTVVLRGVDAQGHRLSFHTDTRSPKFAELRRDPRAALIFYDPNIKTQIRVEGDAMLHAGDALSHATWANMGKSAKRTYAIEPGPGTVQPGPDDAAFSAGEAQAQTRFAVVWVAIASIDWLYLRAEGHRRLRFARAGAGFEAAWLTP